MRRCNPRPRGPCCRIPRSATPSSALSRWIISRASCSLRAQDAGQKIIQNPASSPAPPLVIPASYSNTTVLLPYVRTRRSRCRRTARASHHLFQIAPFSNQVVHRIAMRDPHHLLLDDGTLVEVHGDVVPGGADQLHPAGKGTLVRLGARKGRQKRMVDIDNPVWIGVRKFLAEDLHVARQHHQFNIARAQFAQLQALLFQLVPGRDREMPERNMERGNESSVSAWLPITTAISAWNSSA